MKKGDFEGKGDVALHIINLSTSSDREDSVIAHALRPSSFVVLLMRTPLPSAKVTQIAMASRN